MTSSDWQQDILRHERFQSAMAGAQTGLMAMQTSTMSFMSKRLVSINGSMARVEQNSAATLAIHQEMLSKEEFQDTIEEFLFASNKLLDLFHQDLESGQRELSVVSIYRAVRNIVDSVQTLGIDTSAIRGRENKEAFVSLLDTTNGLIEVMERGSKEVRAAIEKEKAEKEQAEKAERWAAEERAKRQSKIESQLATLRAQRRTLTFKQWYVTVVTKRLQTWFSDDSKATLVLIGFFRCVLHVTLLFAYGIVWIPILFLVTQRRLNGFLPWYKETITKRINSIIKCDGATARLLFSIVAFIPGVAVIAVLHLTTKESVQKQLNAEVDQQIAPLEKELCNYKSPFLKTEVYIQ